MLVLRAVRPARLRVGLEREVRSVPSAPSCLAAPVVAPLTESRPSARRWVLTDRWADPSQPFLDLRPPGDPLVLAPLVDLADRAPAGLPDARAWGRALAVTLLEVLTGRRPGHQLSRWLSEEVLTALAPRLPGRRPPGRPAPACGLRSLRVQLPATGVAEVGVHGLVGQRGVALAFRLEVQQDRWACTALELGPLP